MSRNIAPGEIWKDKRSGKELSIAGIALNGSVQLINDDGYKIMSQESLFKNYAFVSTKTASKPEPTREITGVEIDPDQVTRINEVNNNKGKETKTKMADEIVTEEKTEEKETAARQPASMVKLATGEIVSGLDFIEKVAGETRETTYKKLFSPVYWMRTSKKGQELLKKFNAELVVKEKKEKTPEVTQWKFCCSVECMTGYSCIAWNGKDDPKIPNLIDCDPTKKTDEEKLACSYLKKQTMSSLTPIFLKGRNSYGL